MSGKRGCVVLLCVLVIGFFAGIVLGMGGRSPFMSNSESVYPPHSAKSDGVRKVPKGLPPSKSETPEKLKRLSILDTSMGEVVSVIIQAKPGQVCTLLYRNSHSIPQILPLPSYQQADQQGKCTWQWRLSDQEVPGDAMVVYSVDDLTRTDYFRIVKK